jgi:hypothetical protein
MLLPMFRTNHARRSNRRDAPSVNSSCRPIPEYNHAAVSQKLSQQYSRHRRERPVTSSSRSACLRHSALHPSSPRARPAISARTTSSKLSRIAFPNRTHTKCATSCTKIRGNSARVQSSAIRRSRKKAPPCTAPPGSLSPRTRSTRTTSPASPGMRFNTASPHRSSVESANKKREEFGTLFRVPSRTPHQKNARWRPPIGTANGQREK